MNRIQELNLELISLASFNEFDGEKVAADLKAHPELWRAVIMDCSSDMPLLKLRDLPGNYWNVDTLNILVIPGQQGELEILASTWLVDELEWVGGRKAARLIGSLAEEEEYRLEDDKVILSLWWD